MSVYFAVSSLLCLVFRLSSLTLLSPWQMSVEGVKGNDSINAGYYVEVAVFSWKNAEVHCLTDAWSPQRRHLYLDQQQYSCISSHPSGPHLQLTPQHSFPAAWGAPCLSPPLAWEKLQGLVLVRGWRHAEVAGGWRWFCILSIPGAWVQIPMTMRSGNWKPINMGQEGKRKSLEISHSCFQFYFFPHQQSRPLPSFPESTPIVRSLPRTPHGELEGRRQAGGPTLTAVSHAQSSHWKKEPVGSKTIGHEAMLASVPAPLQLLFVQDEATTHWAAPQRDASPHCCWARGFKAGPGLQEDWAVSALS